MFNGPWKESDLKEIVIDTVDPEIDEKGIYFSPMTISNLKQNRYFLSNINKTGIEEINQESHYM